MQTSKQSKQNQSWCIVRSVAVQQGMKVFVQPTFAAFVHIVHNVHWHQCIGAIYPDSFSLYIRYIGVMFSEG